MLPSTHQYSSRCDCSSNEATTSNAIRRPCLTLAQSALTYKSGESFCLIANPSKVLAPNAARKIPVYRNINVTGLALAGLAKCRIDPTENRASRVPKKIERLY